MNSIWIARDENNWLTLFTAEPHWDDDEKWWHSDDVFNEALDSRSFPDIKPGECREFRAVEVQCENE
jgi:hypothetical protein